jgi:serine/threonine protein kinase
MSEPRTDVNASRGSDATLPPDRTRPGVPLPSGAASFPGLTPPQAPGELGRLGGYRVVKVLGQGGMGVVFQAEDLQLGRSVALKMMLPELAASPEAHDRFLREARAQAQIEHDHIVPIYQVGVSDGVPFLAMPLLRGLSLEDYLNKGKPLPLAHIVRIGREVARGLQAAHERGLIHRDIKPANLWLDATTAGRIKILDFGLARPQQASSQLTASGVIVGTPAYMPPEQIAGKPEPRSDLYSLGVVLYRMLAGRLPFDQPDMLALLMAVATEPPPPLQKVAPQSPAALARLVMRLLQKKPDDRPGSAREVHEALRTIERELTTATGAATGPVDVELDAPTEMEPVERPAGPKKRKSTPPRKRKPARRRLWPLLLLGGVMAVIVLAVAGLSAFLFLTPRQQPQKPPDDPRNGFTSLFNGKDLTGWQGAVPLPERARLQGEALKNRQAAADELAKAIWSVKDGLLTATPLADRKRGVNLATVKDYRNFELKLDWKIEQGGDSGVYLRGQPQVQIWDSDTTPGARGKERGSGSGGLWNNPEDRGKHPLKKADNTVGEWNTFRIIVKDDKVTVYLNETVVVDKQPLLNTLEAGKPVPRSGPIELQYHTGPAWFRNISIRELPDGNQRAASGGDFKNFNGEDLKGWKIFPSGTGDWKVKDGILISSGPQSHLFSERDDYKNFHVKVEAKINDKGNSGLYFRTQFGPGFPRGYEAQINATHSDPIRTGSLHPSRESDLRGVNEILVLKAPHKPDEWFTQEVICQGAKITILVNGKKTVEWTDPRHRFKQGHFALQQHDPGTVVQFRKIEVKELPGQ